MVKFDFAWTVFDVPGKGPNLKEHPTLCPPVRQERSTPSVGSVPLAVIHMSIKCSFVVSVSFKETAN